MSAEQTEDMTGSLHPAPIHACRMRIHGLRLGDTIDDLRQGQTRACLMHTRDLIRGGMRTTSASVERTEDMTGDHHPARTLACRMRTHVPRTGDIQSRMRMTMIVRGRCATVGTTTPRYAILQL